MEVADLATLSRRERLRLMTGAVHQTLDDKVSRADFLTTRSGYNAFLLATFEARRLLESQLDAGGAELIYPGWGERRLVPALEKDLDDLDLTRPAEREPPARLGKGGVWGALYVLEGSALGARIIQRRAADLGFTASFGARHLASQTSEVGAWKRFTSHLDAAVLDGEEDRDCVTTALDTFGRFERSYDRLA